jgi:hypothetical protein
LKEEVISKMPKWVEVNLRTNRPEMNQVYDICVLQGQGDFTIVENSFIFVDMTTI